MVNHRANKEFLINHQIFKKEFPKMYLSLEGTMQNNIAMPLNQILWKIIIQKNISIMYLLYLN